MNDQINQPDRILIVDDEPHVISALCRALAETGYEIAGSTSGEEALRLMERESYKVVVSDEKMGGMQGTEFLANVRVRHPKTVRMMLTGNASLDLAMKAVNRGEIYRFFTKPWNDIELQLALMCAVEKYDLEEEIRQLSWTVKRQLFELQYLESHYPGITEIRRDASGAIQLELTEEPPER
ncbi:response regulator [Geomesophilobacter sediminis]|uniref:Response regulator n=1 Tax=Geomesophilobacter sediminis TaxID=2798584 RepID=A0A8J7M1W2_9BACT|nr:response regulator [Geomesophilobacter sediminis]MBJ6727155.1 response regulator [Geomesophilobacter sediminis]